MHVSKVSGCIGINDEIQAASSRSASRSAVQLAGFLPCLARIPVGLVVSSTCHTARVIWHLTCFYDGRGYTMHNGQTLARSMDAPSSGLSR